MATLDWSQCPAVESIPGKVSGAWVFQDTRLPVSTIFENLESGATIDEIIEWFDVTREENHCRSGVQSLDLPDAHHSPEKNCAVCLTTERPRSLVRS